METNIIDLYGREYTFATFAPSADKNKIHEMAEEMCIPLKNEFAR